MIVMPSPECPYCRGFHAGICPRAYAVEARIGDMVQRTEFKPRPGCICPPTSEATCQNTACPRGPNASVETPTAPVMSTDELTAFTGTLQPQNMPASGVAVRLYPLPFPHT